MDILIIDMCNFAFNFLGASTYGPRGLSHPQPEAKIKCARNCETKIKLKSNTQ